MNQLIAAPDGSGSLQQKQKVETVKTLWFAIQFVFQFKLVKRQDRHDKISFYNVSF
ncbi:hypothetical protein HMPREF0373_01296 [Eubacterium ramulus ATCC 29099]|uniref:Uncharacterized protein n=1 Tax=Eubacterium ramulus ATCC 29099 TaxID=1256908 RepID=U2PTP2_EUBRA|nr:hypothetical protein HMPREF0373_01296 [Eubacterium ramulus ATCC 29099]